MKKIQDEVKKVFLNSFNIKEADFDMEKDRTKFENWDSLAHMQLISDIESSLDISFEMDEIVEINKPADLIMLIKKKKNEQ